MTTRLSLPTSLPGPCPVCGETVRRHRQFVHIGHVDGYNRAIEDVVAWMRLRSLHGALAVERGDAFGDGRRHAARALHLR